MRKFLDTYLFNPLWLKAAFLIFSILYCIPPIMEKMDLAFNVVLVWGMLAVVYEFFFHKTYFSDGFYGFALIACIFYFATFLINGHHVIDLKILFYIIMDLFLFTTNRVTDGSCAKMTDEIRVLAKILVGLTAAIAVISLLTYVLDISIIYRNDVTSVPLILGVHTNGSLYGLIGNSNRHSWLCLISIAFTFWLLSKKKSKWLCANVIVQITVILLSQSRGALAGLAILLVGSLFLFMRGHKKAQLVRYRGILACSLLTVASVFAIYGTAVVLKDTGVQTAAGAGVQTAAGAGVQAVIKKPQQSPDLTLRTEQEKSGNVNARLELYTAGWQMLTEKPVLGFGANELDETTRTFLSAASGMNQKGLANNFHNIFLQTAVQGGGLQLLSLLSLLVYGLVRAIKGLHNHTMDMSLLFLLMGALALLAINMVESEIYMARNFSAVAFWIIYGYCIRYANPESSGRLLALRSKAAKE